MATQSLYRRYRPRRFDELKGQDHVVRALRNAVINNRDGAAGGLRAAGEPRDLDPQGPRLHALERDGALLQAWQVPRESEAGALAVRDPGGTLRAPGQVGAAQGLPLLR